MRKRWLCALFVALALAARLIFPQVGTLCRAWLCGGTDEQLGEALDCFCRTLTREKSVWRAVEAFYEAVEAEN